MLSALDGPPDRRVITLPPIREPQSGRGPPPAPKTRPPSSSESSRSGYIHRRDDRGGGARRYPSPTRSRGVPRSYSEESLDGRSRSGARGGTGRPRSRSRDDLLAIRPQGGYSPPASRQSRGGSWSSDDEGSSRRGGARRGRGSSDKPPSYTEYEPGQKPGARRNERYSVRHSLL